MSEMSTLQWEIDQLVKTELFSDESAVLRSALRALYSVQPHLKRQIVVRAYTAGEISLGKAAENFFRPLRAACHVHKNPAAFILLFARNYIRAGAFRYAVLVLRYCFQDIQRVFYFFRFFPVKNGLQKMMDVVVGRRVNAQKRNG